MLGNIAALPDDFQKIHFTDDGTPDGTPLAPGFRMNSCWGAMGYHYNGNVYVAISNHDQDNGNVALFRYDVNADKMHFINDIRSISTAAGNWEPNDTHYKIHSELKIHADGKVYMTTQEDDNPRFLGAKMYVLDSVDHVIDYTAASAYYLDRSLNTQSGNAGHLVEKQGIIALGVNPRIPDVMYCITVMDGWLLLFNPRTGYVKKLVLASYFGSNISRNIGVDNNGNAYLAMRIDSNRERVYKYRLADSSWYAIGDPFPETGRYSEWGGFMAMVPTASNETLYARTFDGQHFRVVYATEAVENLGQGYPEVSYGDHNLAISRDGNHLYSLKMNWQTPTMPGLRFYDYDISADSSTRTDYIPLYQGYDLAKGMHIADAYGNLYFAGWSGSGGNGFDNIALLKVHLGTDLVEPNPPLSVWNVGIRPPRLTRPAPVALTDVAAWPSPFTDRTVIGFRSGAGVPVEVTIYDTRARLVRTLVPEPGPAGYRMVSWDGLDLRNRSLPPGVYVYEIIAGEKSARGSVLKAR